MARTAVLLVALALLWMLAGPRGSGGGGDGDPLIVAAGDTDAVATTTPSSDRSGHGRNGDGAAAGVAADGGDAKAVRSYVVHVAGAVQRPGVYRVRAPGRLIDAVERAGGATANADLTQINLAARLADGTQIVVPAHGDGGARTTGAAGGGGTGGGGAGAGGSATVNLNTASSEELQTLDGVGPATAEAIIKTRTERGGFKRFEELQEVPGIGAKRLESLRAQAGL